MPSNNTKSHHEDLRKAILFHKVGDIDRAKQQLDKILEQVNDTWDAEEVRVRARSLAEQIHRKEGLVKSRRIVSTVILINAIVLGALALTPVKSVYIDGDIVTSMVQISNSERISIGEMAAASIDLSAFGKLTLDDAALNELFVSKSRLKTIEKNAGGPTSPRPPAQLLIFAASSFSNVTIEGSPMSIQYMDVYPGSTISIYHGQDWDTSIFFELKSGRIEGEVMLHDNGSLVLYKADFGDHKNWSGDVGISKDRPIVFDSDGMRLHMRMVSSDQDDSEMILLNYMISEIKFTENVDDNEVSKIISGVISLPDYDKKEIKLRRGDFLIIETSDPIPIQHLSLKNPLEITIEGEVTALIRNGRSLKPSLLEWLFKHNLIVLYFVAFSSVASFIWATMKRMDLLRNN